MPPGLVLRVPRLLQRRRRPLPSPLLPLQLVIARRRPPAQAHPLDHLLVLRQVPVLVLVALAVGQARAVLALPVQVPLALVRAVVLVQALPALAQVRPVRVRLVRRVLAVHGRAARVIASLRVKAMRLIVLWPCRRGRRLVP